MKPRSFKNIAVALFVVAFLVVASVGFLLAAPTAVHAQVFQCSPGSQDASVNEEVTVTISGGERPYTWSAPGATSYEGELTVGNTITTSYLQAGEYAIMIRDGGNGQIQCTVSVTGDPSKKNIFGDFSKCDEDALKKFAISAILGFFGLTVPTTDIPNIIKENIEDCALWVASNVALEKITDEVVQQANTGFNGNPQYVTSISQELQRTSDSAFLSVVQSGELDGLPSAFRNDVLFSLIDNYNRRNDFRNRTQSTLDEGLYDIDAFTRGDFSQGGWDTWFKLTQEPQNNPYGAWLLAQEEVDRRIASSVENKELEITSGRGFLNKEVCENVEVGTRQQLIYEFVEELGRNEIIDTEEIPITELRCRTVTPGAIIQETLQKTLGVGVDRIIQADETNEAFSKLQAGIFSNITSSPEGLSGSGEFIQESQGFVGLELPGPLEGGGSGSEIGACDVPAGTTLSAADQAAVVNVSRWPSQGRGIQVVFLSGNRYRVDTRINNIQTKYPQNGASSLAAAGSAFCTATGANCSGGSLSPAEQQAVLSLAAWANSRGPSRGVALRFESGGRIFIDWFAAAATGGTVEHPDIPTAVNAFCPPSANP